MDKVILTQEIFDQELPGTDRPLRGDHVLADWHLDDGQTHLTVNIVAPNGGGKSILPTLMGKVDKDHYWITGEEGKKIATIFPNLGWAAVGYYRTACGGCDSLDLARIFEAMYKLCGTNLNVVMEGSIVSNTRWTYWNAYQGIHEKFPTRRPMFVVMDYPYQTYYERVMKRNGDKPIKESCLQQKFNNIKRYIPGYVQDGPNVGVAVHIERSEGVIPMFRSVVAAMDKELDRPSLPLLG